MTTLNVGDRVRITKNPHQVDPDTGYRVEVGDLGTVTDALNDLPEAIQIMFGGAVPLFVEIDGKPVANLDGDDGAPGWALLSTEVELVAVPEGEDAA